MTKKNSKSTAKSLKANQLKSVTGGRILSEHMERQTQVTQKITS